jgi:hypothetical protein
MSRPDADARPSQLEPGKPTIVPDAAPSAATRRSDTVNEIMSFIQIILAAAIVRGGEPLESAWLLRAPAAGWPHGVQEPEPPRWAFDASGSAS